MKIILNLMLLSLLMWTASFAQDIPVNPQPEVPDTTKSDTLTMSPDTLGDEAASDIISEETPTESEPETVLDAEPEQLTQETEPATRPDQTEEPPGEVQAQEAVTEKPKEEPEPVEEEKVEIPEKVVYEAVGLTRPTTSSACVMFRLS